MRGTRDAMSDSAILHVRLDDDVREALVGVESRTDYVHDLVLDRHNEWMEALGHLRDSGWTPRSLCAAMDALRLVPFSIRSARRVAMEMEDAQRLRRVAETHGVPLTEWNALLVRVGDDATLHASALRLLARAYWSADKAVAARVGEGKCDT